VDEPQNGLAVVDIDGVVADVGHRLHYLDQRPKDWAGFFATAASDPPLPTGLALVRDLATKHDVVWLTGRPSWLESTTRTWLRAHDLPDAELYMRGASDRRPARVYKVEVLRRFAPRQVSAFVDDDEQVVMAARSAGFPAILADWAPQSRTLRNAQERSGRS
jgi:uncharacterized HAD superfamily protein